MSTADDASTLRRRRPPVVRINLEPNEDASDSAQSSPRAPPTARARARPPPHALKVRTARGRRSRRRARRRPPGRRRGRSRSCGSTSRGAARRPLL